MSDYRWHTLACIEDGVSDLLYYDRKEDEDLPRDAIEGLVAEGILSVDEMVDHFRKHLIKGLEVINDED